MMYLVSTLAAGAAAVELRNLAVNATDKKITLNGHGLAAGQLLAHGENTTTGGLAAKTLYVVVGAQTNDFQLKGAKAGDLSADGALISVTDDFTDKKLTSYGSKKCIITDGSKDGADAHKVVSTTCGAAGIALTDKMIVYCETPSGNTCKVDGADTFPHFGAVYARAANENKFEITQTAPADPQNPVAQNKVEYTGTMHAESKGKVWLVKEDTTSFVYPTRAAAGNTWDKTANKGVMSSTSTLTAGSVYFYTAGSTATCASATATCNLATGKPYSVHAVSGEPWSFKLKTLKAKADGTLEDDADVVVDSEAGAGESYHLVSNGRQITASTAADNTITVKGDNTGNEYAATTAGNKLRLKFYCLNSANDGCKYNVAGMDNGAVFKIKTATNNNTDDVKIVLQAQTGSAEAVAVSDNSTADKGYAFTQVDGTAAIEFPTAAAAGAAAAGSAARSFAMLGSAVAMATAFLLA